MYHLSSEEYTHSQLQRFWQYLFWDYGLPIVVHFLKRVPQRAFHQVVIRYKLFQYLQEHAIKYKLDKEQVVVYATGINDVLEITTRFKESIKDIEINKGTLNDVFIAITGKEIRE